MFRQRIDEAPNRRSPCFSSFNVCCTGSDTPSTTSRTQRRIIVGGSRIDIANVTQTPPNAENNLRGVSNSCDQMFSRSRCVEKEPRIKMQISTAKCVNTSLNSDIINSDFQINNKMAPMRKISNSNQLPQTPTSIPTIPIVLKSNSSANSPRRSLRSVTPVSNRQSQSRLPARSVSIATNYSVETVNQKNQKRNSHHVTQKVMTDRIPVSSTPSSALLAEHQPIRLTTAAILSSASGQKRRHLMEELDDLSRKKRELEGQLDGVKWEGAGKFFERSLRPGQHSHTRRDLLAGYNHSSCKVEGYSVRSEEGKRFYSPSTVRLRYPSRETKQKKIIHDNIIPNNSEIELHENKHSYFHNYNTPNNLRRNNKIIIQSFDQTINSNLSPSHNENDAHNRLMSPSPPGANFQPSPRRPKGASRLHPTSPPHTEILMSFTPPHKLEAAQKKEDEDEEELTKQILTSSCMPGQVKSCSSNLDYTKCDVIAPPSVLRTGVSRRSSHSLQVLYCVDTPPPNHEERHITEVSPSRILKSRSVSSPPIRNTSSAPSAQISTSPSPRTSDAVSRLISATIAVLTPPRDVASPPPPSTSRGRPLSNVTPLTSIASRSHSLKNFISQKQQPQQHNQTNASSTHTVTLYPRLPSSFRQRPNITKSIKDYNEKDHCAASIAGLHQVVNNEKPQHPFRPNLYCNNSNISRSDTSGSSKTRFVVPQPINNNNTNHISVSQVSTSFISQQEQRGQHTSVSLAAQLRQVFSSQQDLNSRSHHSTNTTANNICMQFADLEALRQAHVPLNTATSSILRLGNLVPLEPSVSNQKAVISGILGPSGVSSRTIDVLQKTANPSANSPKSTMPLQPHIPRSSPSWPLSFQSVKLNSMETAQTTETRCEASEFDHAVIVDNIPCEHDSSGSSLPPSPTHPPVSPSASPKGLMVRRGTLRVSDFYAPANRSEEDLNKQNKSANYDINTKRQDSILTPPSPISVFESEQQAAHYNSHKTHYNFVGSNFISQDEQLLTMPPTLITFSSPSKLNNHQDCINHSVCTNKEDLNTGRISTCSSLLKLHSSSQKQLQACPSLHNTSGSIQQSVSHNSDENPFISSENPLNSSPLTTNNRSSNNHYHSSSHILPVSSPVSPLAPEGAGLFKFEKCDDASPLSHFDGEDNIFRLSQLLSFQQQLHDQHAKRLMLLRHSDEGEEVKEVFSPEIEVSVDKHNSQFHSQSHQPNAVMNKPTIKRMNPVKSEIDLKVQIEKSEDNGIHEKAQNLSPASMGIPMINDEILKIAVSPESRNSVGLPSLPSPDELEMSQLSSEIIPSGAERSIMYHNTPNARSSFFINGNNKRQLASNNNSMNKQNHVELNDNEFTNLTTNNCEVHQPLSHYQQKSDSAPISPPVSPPMSPPVSPNLNIQLLPPNIVTESDDEEVKSSSSKSDIIIQQPVSSPPIFSLFNSSSLVEKTTTIASNHLKASDLSPIRTTISYYRSQPVVTSFPVQDNYTTLNRNASANIAQKLMCCASNSNNLLNLNKSSNEPQLQMVVEYVWPTPNQPPLPN